MEEPSDAAVCLKLQDELDRLTGGDHYAVSPSDEWTGCLIVDNGRDRLVVDDREALAQILTVLPDRLGIVVTHALLRRYAVANPDIWDHIGWSRSRGYHWVE